MTLAELQKLWAKKNGGKAANSEHDLQASCVQWFRLEFPRHAELLMAIPNGGYRTKTTAALMKAEGQKAGVPDLFLAIPHGEYHGLWIEMKNGKAGRLSKAQKTMIERLRAHGYAVVVCRSFLEFQHFLSEYLK